MTGTNCETRGVDTSLGAGRWSAQMPTIDHLSEDMLVKCLVDVAGIGLAACSVISKRWRQLVQAALEQKLAAIAPRPAQEDFNLLLQWMALEQIHEVIGPRPARSWRDEWTEVMVSSLREQCRFGRDYFDGETWDNEMEDHYREIHHPASLAERITEITDDQEVLGLRHGMPLDQTQLFAVLGTSCAEVLFAPRPALAASSYAYYEALSTMARLAKTSTIAPPAYSTLDGQYSVTELDDGWEALHSMSVGDSFVNRRYQTQWNHTADRIHKSCTICTIC